MSLAEHALFQHRVHLVQCVLTGKIQPLRQFLDGDIIPRPDEILAHYYDIAAVILFGIGFFTLLLHKNLIKKIIGLNIMDTSIFLFLASKGYIFGRVAPIVQEGVTNAEAYINPVPSGLVLTGIVVSVSVSAFSLALVQRLYKKYKTVNLDEILVLAKKEEE